LFGGLIREDLADALCLTVAPVVVGGLGGRIGHTPLAEGSLFVRYRRLRDDDPGTADDA
jgi:riboflavin biosynthesis pyrimidine reductase